jgi:stage II sporulation protein AA (anti-sigma F factor antagonist)
MEIKIIATTGRARGQAVEVRAAKYFIGRHDNCQLRPDFPELAGIHALIEHREGQVFLRDFGAGGGTGLNDRVLNAREAEVFDGDLIQIGPMVLTLSIRSKGVHLRDALREAPEGWPFLEGLESSPEPSKVELAPVRVEPKLVHAEPSVIPSRVSAFLVGELEPFSGKSASAVISSPVAHQANPSPMRPSPVRPIITRSRMLRAITCHQVDGVTVVTILSSDLNEEETVSPVRYELRTLIDEEQTPERTVIDLRNTRFLSSRAVGVLLAHFQALERKGGSMRVCRVTKEIQPVLDQMRLSKLVDLFPTLEEAVETPWD